MSALLPIILVVAAIVPLALAWALGRVAGARRIAVALLILGSSYVIDVNLFMHPTYRGMSRSFDIGTTDLLMVAIVAFIFGQIRQRGLVVRAGRRPGPLTPIVLIPPGTLLLVTFIGVCAISLVGAREPLLGLMDLSKLTRGLVVFWVSANLVADDRMARNLPLYMLLFVGVEMTTAVYQHLSGVWWVHGTFDHKNSFAMSMNLFLPTFLADGLRARGRRTGIVLAYGLGALGLVISRSRFGWFTMALSAGFVLVACFGVTLWQRDRRGLVRQLIVIAALAALAVPVAAKSLDSIINRFDEDAEASMDFRHRNNEIATTLAAERPLGVGLNNYVRELDEPIGRLLAPMDRTVAHHLYLYVAAETGYPGLVALVLMLVGFLAMALRLIVRAVKPWSKTFGIGVGAAILAASIHSFGESDLIRRETYFIFCMILGFLAAVTQREGLGGSPTLYVLVRESVRHSRRGLTALVLVGLTLVAPAARASALPKATALSADHVRISFDHALSPRVVPAESELSIDGAEVTVEEVGVKIIPVGKTETPWPPKAIMRTDVFLRLSGPLPEDRPVRITAPSRLLPAPVEVTWSTTRLSPAIKINQVGFLPDDKGKAAFVGLYLGTMGPMTIKATGFEVVDLIRAQVVFRGKLEQVARWDRIYVEDDYKLPFGALTEPGHYAIRVPGIGRSPAFRIGPEVYDGPLVLMLRAYYHHRCGTALDRKYTGYARPACHPASRVACYNEGLKETPLYAGEVPDACRDASGGWHDASDYGKYVPTGAAAVYNLMLAYELWPDRFWDGQLGIPESGNGLPDLLDEVRWELEWLLKMQTEDGGVYHKVASKQWGTGNPPDKDDKRFEYAERTTHDTARVAAVMARAARVYATLAPDDAKRYRASAELAWKFLRAHPGPVPDPGYKEREWTGGGPYADRFGDADERAWAAAEWLALTGEGEGMDELVSREVKKPYNVRVPPLYVRDWPPTFEDSWRMALYTYAQLPKEGRNHELQAAIREAWRVRADDLVSTARTDPYGLSFRAKPGQNFGFGSANGVRYAMDLSLADALTTKNPQHRETALGNLGVLFGANGPGLSFVTGIGQRTVRDIEYRPDLFDGIVEPLPGHPVDGPSTNVHASNRDADEKLYPPTGEFPPGQRYFDMMDPTMSEPTVREMSEAVLAVTPFATPRPADAP